MRSCAVFLLLLAIKAVSRLLFRVRHEFVREVDDPWTGLRVVALLNHTSLFEPVLVAVDSMARVAIHEEVSRKRQAVASGEELDFRSEIENARQSGQRLRGSGDPEPFLSVWSPEPAGLRGTRRGSDNPRKSDSRPAARVRSQKERNQVAIRLLNTWLLEDAKVESDTWELLKASLDRDRLSGRRLWI